MTKEDIMTDDVLEKLGIKRPMSTKEMKEMMLRKPGELTQKGSVITPEGYRLALAIPGLRELRMKQYFDEAYKECIEDIKYNTSSVSTKCVCKKMQDKKFRDNIMATMPPTEEYRLAARKLKFGT